MQQEFFKLIREYLLPIFYLAVAFLLVFRFRRENRGFFYVGAGFGALGAWEVAKLFTGDALTTGFWAYVPKILGVVILVFACYMFVQSKKNDASSVADEKPKDKVPNETGDK